MPQTSRLDYSFPPLAMDTDVTIDPATQEASADPATVDNVETSSETPQPDGERQDSDILKKRLADKDRYIKELEAKTKKPKNEDETLWLIENSQDLKIVKAEYQAELDELVEMGAKPTLKTKQKALKLALSNKGIASENPDVQRQAAISSSTTVNRKSKETVVLSDNMKRMGVKQETVEKYRDYVMG